MDLYLVMMFLTIFHHVFTSTVTLNMKAAACGECHYEHCLSSIKVNGTEKSMKYEGLNVAIINSFTGSVQQKNVFRLGGIVLGRERRRKFIKLFNDIITDSVVVIVTQDPCSLFYDSWFQYLINRINLFKDNYLFGAHAGIVVGCRGSCPKAVIGSLPYTHFSYRDLNSYSLTFQLKELETVAPTVPSSTPTRNTTHKPLVIKKDVNSSSKQNLTLIIGILMSVIFVVVVGFVIIFVYIRKYKRGEEFAEIVPCFQTKVTKNNDEVENSQFTNTTYSQQPNIIPLFPQQSDNYNELTPCHAKYQNTNQNSEYAGLNKDNLEYTKITVSCTDDKDTEYTYISLDDTTKKSTENIYYGVSDDMSRDRSETQLTDLSAISVSPGTSHKIFQNSTNANNEKCNFASYVKFDEKTNIYKAPSNVPKFQPPATNPLLINRESNADAKTAVYDNAKSLYQTLDLKPITEETYQSLNL